MSLYKPAHGLPRNAQVGLSSIYSLACVREVDGENGGENDEGPTTSNKSHV